MAEARSREAWQHTSAVMAAVCNSSFHRTSRTPAVEPADLDPWALADRKKASDDPRVYLPIECLIAAWVSPERRLAARHN